MDKTPTEAVVIHRPRRPREAMIAAHQAATRVFAGLTHGCEILCLTHGQFSLVDAIAAILDHTGPADVVISTWSAARADLMHAEHFLRDGRVRTLRFIVDRSFVTRQPDYCATLVDLFGPDAIRTTASHAKFAVISNAQWRISVRTSMNLNENRRLEHIEVSDDPDLTRFLLKLVDEIFDSVPDGEMNNYAMPEGDGTMAPQTMDSREQVANLLARSRPR